MTQNINHQESIGSLKSIQIASVDEIKYCPNILTNSNSHKLEIVGTSDTLDFLPLVEKISVSNRSQRTKSGILYRIKITAEFNTASSLIDSHFKKYHHKKVVVVAQDQNNQERVYGSEKHPLFFNYQESIGKQQEQGQKTTLTIEGKISQKPVYIDTSMV